MQGKTTELQSFRAQPTFCNMLDRTSKLHALSRFILVPQEKLDSITLFVCTWLNTSSRTKTVLQSLIGDGDSKAHKLLLQEAVYEDISIEKLECIGYV